MALQDMLGGLPPGLLSAEQQAQAERQARNALITNLGFGLLQASRGQPGQGKPSLGQMVGQVGPSAVQAYQGSFDKTLRDLLIGQQLEDAKKKRERQTQIEALAPRLLTEVRGPETVTQDVYDARDALAQGGQITRPGEVVGYQVNRALLPGVAALGPEGAELATRMLSIEKATQPEERVLKPGDIVTRGGEVIFQAPAEFKGYDKIDLGNTIAFVDPKNPTKIVAQMAKTKDPEKLGGVEDTVRKEFLGQAKSYIEIGQAYKKIEESAKTPSAAGDLALIFNYMKILDPGSVVREGEFATAQNAAGIPDRIRAQYNQVLNGQRLAETQRADFLNQAKNITKSQKDNFNQTLVPFYTRIVEDRNLNKSNVLFDPFEGVDLRPTAPKASGRNFPGLSPQDMDLINRNLRGNQ
jgi:hypothetical protein